MRCDWLRLLLRAPGSRWREVGVAVTLINPLERRLMLVSVGC